MGMYCYKSRWKDVGDRIVGQLWHDEYCAGKSYMKIELANGCEPNEDKTEYKRHDCYSSERGELRNSNSNQKQAGNIAIIFAVLLSIVCIIGIIAGYALNRKRKKLAQQTLLCNEAR